jgi:hypothetical protein
MGTFLHKLWDETLAGPPPDTGFGKLRKYNSFSAARSPPIVADHEAQISRSITILKTNSTIRNLSVDPRSAESLAESTSTPRTPLTRKFDLLEYIVKVSYFYQFKILK